METMNTPSPKNDQPTYAMLADMRDRALLAERERDEWSNAEAAANRCFERANQELLMLKIAIRDVERERDEARERVDTMFAKFVDILEQTRNERDELRAQLREEQQLHVQTLNELDEARETSWFSNGIEYRKRNDYIEARNNLNPHWVVVDSQTKPETMNTDTPETDGEWNRLACQDHPEFERNLADFARKLERERNEWRNEHDRVVREYQHRLVVIGISVMEAAHYPENARAMPPATGQDHGK